MPEALSLIDKLMIVFKFLTSAHTAKVGQTVREW